MFTLHGGGRKGKIRSELHMYMHIKHGTSNDKLVTDEEHDIEKVE